MKHISFIALILLGSCASLNTISSEEHTSDKASSFNYSNSDSNVLYSVSNDNENLYISLNTSETTSIAKILRTGLTIYFDVKGKKGKDIYIQYPQDQEQKLSREEAPTPSNNNAHTPKIDLAKLFAQMSPLATYTNRSETENFSVLDTESDIKISIDAVRGSEIIYQLAIPFNRISSGGKADLSNLSVGIVSGRFDPPANAGGGQGSGQGQSGGGQGMSGGGQGGGQGRGQGKGMSGGGQSQGNMSAMTTPIKFWFKVDLPGIE